MVIDLQWTASFLSFVVENPINFRKSCFSCSILIMPFSQYTETIHPSAFYKLVNFIQIKYQSFLQGGKKSPLYFLNSSSLDFFLMYYLPLALYSFQYLLKYSEQILFNIMDMILIHKGTKEKICIVSNLPSLFFFQRCVLFYMLYVCISVGGCGGEYVHMCVCLWRPEA